MVALERWLRVLVIALVATAGGISCNNGLAAVTAGRMGALVATAGSIGCNSGLAANGQPHWLSVIYNSIFGLEIKCFLRYTELMQLMWLRHSHHTSVARRNEAR